MATTTPKFELSTIPDQQAADGLVKELLKHDFEITDDDEQIAAWAIVQKHDAVIKKLTEGEPAADGKPAFIGFDGFVSTLHNLHKSAVALRAQFVGPLEQSRKKWLARYQAYKDAREAEERRKNEQLAEAQRKADAKKLEQDAKKFEKRGELESATVLREQAKTMPAPTLPFSRPVAKQAGEVERGAWVFEVQDYAKVPDEFKLLDHTKKGERDLIDSKVRAVVSKLGDKLKIEGVRVWYEKSTSSRS